MFTDGLSYPLTDLKGVGGRVSRRGTGDGWVWVPTGREEIVTQVETFQRSRNFLETSLALLFLYEDRNAATGSDE